MRFNLLTSFAAGIFITTTICGVVYFSGKGEVSKASVKAPTSAHQTTVKAQLSNEEMKSKLTNAGYVVQTKAEYDKKIKAAKAGTQKKAASKDNKSNSSTQKTVYRAVINVSQGMTSIDVGNMLKQANLIPQDANFSKDIENRGLENSLRPGTFVVDSQMSYDQIISTIFKK